METILYVDDLLELNYSYVKILKSKYKVIIAESPEETLPSLQSFKQPQYVILDLDMPEPEIINEPLSSCWQQLGEPENSYGLVVAAWIKKHTKEIKVILLSAVPGRFDEYRDELEGTVVLVLDRLTCTPPDLLNELENLINLNN